VINQQSGVISPDATLDVSIAHSPDSDDAFMFYGLATGKVRVPGYRFSHTLSDIETLNRRAQDEAFFDITAISFHAYPYLQQNYTLMGCGGSVARATADGRLQPQAHPGGPGQDQDRHPGTLTTAYLALKIFNPNIQTEVVPFDQIIPAILAGTYDAGLIIHEGQLTYSSSGLYKVLDLGIWWRETTGLVLPLGGNAIRRSLGPEKHKILSKALRDSIQHALDHREQALEYAMQFARDLDTTLASRFVSMYVNERTLDYGADGARPSANFWTWATKRGSFPSSPRSIL